MRHALIFLLLISLSRELSAQQIENLPTYRDAVYIAEIIKQNRELLSKGLDPQKELIKEVEVLMQKYDPAYKSNQLSDNPFTGDLFYNYLPELEETRAIGAEDNVEKIGLKSLSRIGGLNW